MVFECVEIDPKKWVYIWNYFSIRSITSNQIYHKLKYHIGHVNIWNGIEYICLVEHNTHMNHHQRPYAFEGHLWKAKYEWTIYIYWLGIINQWWKLHNVINIDIQNNYICTIYTISKLFFFHQCHKKQLKIMCIKNPTVVPTVCPAVRTGERKDKYPHQIILHQSFRQALVFCT